MADTPNRPPDPIPPALRPGDTDDVLESSRLTSITRWGMIIAIFFAVFLFFYMISDPSRRLSKEKKFDEVSLERGEKYYALRTDPKTGEENLSGKECARCHGVDAEGGTNNWLNPNTGVTQEVQVPDLEGVFGRYEEPPEGYKDAREFIYETIERGRPGTDMPTWGNKYGGPLNEQEINDIVNWLESIQKKAEFNQEATGEEIFNKACATCHGRGGAGGSGPAMTGGSEAKQFPNIDDHIKFVTEGSKPGQPYGTSGQGTGGMPAKGGQKLTDGQVLKVVEYERTL